MGTHRVARTLCFMIAGLLLVFGTSGCGGSDGGGDPYDFNGSWQWSATCTVANPPRSDIWVGRSTVAILRIAQTGSEIAVTYVKSGETVSGFCDAEAGTFHVDFDDGHFRGTLSGARMDEQTLQVKQVYTHLDDGDYTEIEGPATLTPR